MFWLVLVFFCEISSAFDILPEYQGLSEADLLKFETPLEVDSEYQTIMNAYTYSAEWEREWSESRRALDLSVGSLSNSRFFQYNRLKIEVPLTDGLNFHFHGFQQRDREVDQTRHILELSQKLTSQFRINAYGEPSTFKRENDIGFALLWLPVQNWQNRFYYTFHDLTRADHNDKPDKFVGGQSPNSVGWSLSGLSGPVWLHAGFRYDQPVKWLRPQESRLFRYSKTLIYADGILRLSDRLRLSTRLQFDETLKAQDRDTAASALTPESWRLSRQFARFSLIEGNPEDPWGLEASLMHAQRRWKALAGEMSHFNELASAALNIRGTRRGDAFDHYRVEYEVGFFRRFGDMNLAPTQKDSPAEHRLQTAYEFTFNNRARLKLALNFDADQWTPAPTFEGGQGQFRTEF